MRKPVALFFAMLGMVTISFGRTRLGDWALSDMLFALAGVVLLIGRLGPSRKSHAARSSTLSPMLLGIGLLLTMATLSSLVAVDPLGSMTVVFRFAWLTLVWLWILQGAAPTVKDCEMLIRGLRWTVLISSTIAIGGYLGVISLSETINETRETGLYDHPNHLGALLVVGLPFFILDAPAPPSGRRRAIWRWSLIGFVCMAIFTTGSLTSVMGIVVAGVTVISTTSLTNTRRHSRAQPLLRLLGVVAVVLAATYALQSSTPALERFQDLGNDDSGTSASARSRLSQSDVVLSNVDQLLILGVGLDSSSAAIYIDNDQGMGGLDNRAKSGESEEMHNIYLKLLHNAGMLALVGFFIVVLTSLRNSWVLVLHTRGTQLYASAVGLLASLVAVNVVAQFRTPLYQRYFWVSIVLIGTMWVACRNELQAENGTELAPVEAATATERRLEAVPSVGPAGAPRDRRQA